MSIFNSFKKNFSSNFNENQFDEILITTILLERMTDADGIYSQEEEDFSWNYLHNVGYSNEKKISKLIDKKDSITDDEFNTIISKLKDTQKLRIITELVNLIGIDNHISDKEVDYLFKISNALEINNSIVQSILETMKKSLKNANKSLPKDIIETFERHYLHLKTNLRLNTEDSKKIGKNNDLDDIWIVDYQYWFEFIEKRITIPIDPEDDSAEIRMINGHYEEYHFRMLDQSDENKTQFIFMRFKAFYHIYNYVIAFNTRSYSEIELSKYYNLLFHSKTSFYGAVKFAIMDIKDGKELLDKNNIKFDDSLVNQKTPNNAKIDEITEKAVKLFSKSFLNVFNSFLSENADNIIKDKKNTRYKAVVDNINTLFPLSDDKSDKDIIDIHDSNYYNAFSQSQIDYFNTSFSALILTSKNFEFIDYYDFLIDFHKKTNLQIPDIIKDEINEAKDTQIIDSIESQLGGDDNPNRNLFLWAVDMNEGKKGTNISEEKINKMIEEDLLSAEKLPDTSKMALELDVPGLAYMSYGGFIRIDIDYMANILNDSEDDKFYRWKDLEQYHAIYTLVYNYIDKTYVSKYSG
jgi:uncharacterized tellurite resistance protein B-like protein